MAAAEWTAAYEQLRRGVICGAVCAGLSVLQHQGMSAWMKASRPAIPDVSLPSTSRIDPMRAGLVAQMLASVALVRLMEG